MARWQNMSQKTLPQKSAKAAQIKEVRAELQLSTLKLASPPCKEQLLPAQSPSQVLKEE